jgi:hypothetical protein
MSPPRLATASPTSLSQCRPQCRPGARQRPLPAAREPLLTHCGRAPEPRVTASAPFSVRRQVGTNMGYARRACPVPFVCSVRPAPEQNDGNRLQHDRQIREQRPVVDVVQVVSACSPRSSTSSAVDLPHAGDARLDPQAQRELRRPPLALALERGAGTTKLISPRRTFTAAGPRRGEVLRRNRPARTRGSSRSLNKGPSASLCVCNSSTMSSAPTTIVRNRELEGLAVLAEPHLPEEHRPRESSCRVPHTPRAAAGAATASSRP